MVEIRQYQQRIIDDVRQKIAEGKRKILVTLPTGGGKSVIASRIMQLTTEKGKDSIFFASQRELVTQIGKQLARIDVPSRTVMAGVKQEYSSYEEHAESRCTLIARDTLWQRAFRRNKMELPPADVMQIDECLTGDALVSTTDGLTPLENVRPGTMVRTVDVENGMSLTFKRVTAFMDKGEREVVIVRYEDKQCIASPVERSIRCTAEHPVFTKRGWVKAGELTSADHLCCVPRWFNSKPYCDEWVEVNSVETGGVERVYDITVEDTHCFFANGVLVHNCHQVGCPTYNKIMQAYEHSIIIGWTATPCRTDNKPLGGWFDSMVMGASYSELQSLGFLVPVKVIAPNRPDLKGLKVSKGDYNAKDLQQRMNRDQMVGNIVDEWMSHGQGRSTVLFASGVDHSIHCRDEFRRKGITAEHIDGTMPAEERDDIMFRAREGKVTVLCNFGVLHTGVDVPQWKVMICARPTKSFGLWRQMGGRIQRPYPGHDHCLLLDHSDNALTFGFPDEDVEWDIEGDVDQAKKHMDTKKREKGEKSSDPYTCEKCKTMYRGYSCPSCGHKPERRGKEIEMSREKLVELERKKLNAKTSVNEKQKHWDQCMGIAINKGLKIGAAAHMYKTKFGVFPRGLENMPRASQWQMQAKDFYRNVVKPNKVSRDSQSWLEEVAK